MGSEMCIRDSVDAKRYASLAARANYLGLDRPDITFIAKELMRRLSCPDQSDYKKLKRLARYLVGARPALYADMNGALSAGSWM